MAAEEKQPRAPLRRVALLLLATALLVAAGVVAVIWGDQALLDHVESR